LPKESATVTEVLNVPPATGVEDPGECEVSVMPVIVTTAGAAVTANGADEPLKAPDVTVRF
jgi:hypothetical protein